MSSRLWFIWGYVYRGITEYRRMICRLGFRLPDLGFRLQGLGLVVPYCSLVTSQVLGRKHPSAGMLNLILGGGGSASRRI